MLVHPVTAAAAAAGPKMFEIPDELLPASSIELSPATSSLSKSSSYPLCPMTEELMPA